MSYSKRVMEIISILLRQSDYLAVSKIAEEMNISKRTVFREMDAVDSLVTELGMTLKKKTRLGFKLEVTQAQLEAFNHLKSGQVNHEYTMDQRQHFITIELLKSREPKKFYYFSKQLEVSEATISYDMDKIEPWFEKRHITLVRKPGYGVYLDGKESQFRKAIVDFLYENYEHQDIVSLLKNSENMVESVIDKDILIKIVTILKQYENALEQRLTDQSYMGLVIHLAIAVQRITRGESVLMNQEILSQLQRDVNYEIASAIGDSVEEAFDIKFPKDELGYITMHLKGAKLKTGALVDQNDMILTNFELSRLAVKMMTTFKNQSGYDLSDDEKLLVGLISHLRPAVTRMKLDLDIRNPLLDKIKEMYPEIFHMTGEACQIIEEEYRVKVPESEVGYLAMHFGAAIERRRKTQSLERKIRTGVVCTSGIGTSSLLHSKLSKIFPKIALIGQFSKEDIMSGQIKNEDVDLLVSTISLDYCECPVMVVNPLLLEEDIRQISQAISLLASQLKPYKPIKKKRELPINEIKTINLMTGGILEIEEGFKLYHDISAKNMTQLIKHICGIKTVDKSSKNQLYQQLMAREKMGTTVLHDEKIALIHAKTSATHQLNFSVWRLKKEFCHKDQQWIDTAVTMLVPEKCEKVQMALMSQLSKGLVEEPLFLETIKGGSEAEILNMIQSIVHKWLAKQMARTNG